MLKESDLIRSLQKHALPAPAGVWGMGDDAAVLPFNDQESYVLSKDLLVEDRHFRRRYFTPEDLAHKTLHVNLSDIAAMGAAPVFVMMGIALPASIDADWAERFTTSFTQLCAQEGVCLIGGDTTASERDLFLSITIIGRAPSAHLKFRKGAGAGDILCLAGRTVARRETGSHRNDGCFRWSVYRPIPPDGKQRTRRAGGDGNSSPLSSAARGMRRAGA